jgi:hypothetical protein
VGWQIRAHVHKDPNTVEPPPGPPPVAPLATFDDLPLIKLTAVYQTGDTFQDVLNRAASAASNGNHYLEIPSGYVGEGVDFLQPNHYSIYGPKCCGFRGPGPDEVLIQMRKNSSTQVSLVPAQSTKQNNPLFFMRIGPNNSSSGRAVHMEGVTLKGTDQAVDPNTGMPHAYGGFSNYWGRGATFENVRFKAFPGTWNSPPGETTEYNGYNDQDTIWRNVESDGMNDAGVRVGGGTGGGGARRWLIDGAYVHDSRVSGFALGTSGAPATGTQCDSVTTKNLTIKSNANHSTAGGQTFNGLNHEGFTTFVHHFNTDIWVDNQPNVGKAHFTFNNAQTNCPDIQIIDPVWHGDTGGSPTWANGCLVIAVADAYAGSTDGVNKQTSLPYVELNGVQLTPIDYANRSQAVATKNYIRTH